MGPSRLRWAAAAFLLWLGPVHALPADFHLCTRTEIHRMNRALCGRLLDFTRNHDGDYRFCSPALGEKRDMYVYLPPGYDGLTAFPVMIWMHGFGQDEKTFLDFVPVLDQGIRAGHFPPMIIAAPDGSIRGRPSVWNNGSFYMNSKAGCYADYITQDVWNFVNRNYRIRPEREAHVLAGGSMGGFGAFSLGFQHRETFGVLAGLLPALDVRYADCHDNYFGAYDPNCVIERDHLRRQRVIGRFYSGLLLVRERRLTDSLLGRNPPDGLRSLSAVNPVEMLDALQIQPGEFKMFIGYAGRDEFNLDAQAEHFLDVARRRGICPTTVYVADGRHRSETGKKMVPEFSKWICEALKPYVPNPGCLNCGLSTDLLTAPLRHRRGPLGILPDFGMPMAR